MQMKQKLIYKAITYNNTTTAIIELLSRNETQDSYKTISKSQTRILKLIDEIKTAKSVDELVRLRNRLNYNINKVKTEINKRNIPDSIHNIYCEASRDLRKAIALYLRIVKRQKNIDNIKERLRILNIDSSEIKCIKNCLNNTPNPKPNNLYNKTYDDLLVLKEKIKTYSQKKLKYFIDRSAVSCLAISILTSTSPSIQFLNTRNNIPNDKSGYLKVSASEMLTDKELEVLYDEIIDVTISKNLNENIINTIEFFGLDINTTEKSINNSISNELMSHTIRERECLTKEQLDRLLQMMCVDNKLYKDANEAFTYLYNEELRTYEEKMMIIMVRENLTYEELDTICACITSEAANQYDEGYYVANVLFNRIHNIRWINDFGDNLYGQLTGTGQFQVYYERTYEKYLGCIEEEGYKGAIDMLYSRQSIIDYLGFRSSNFDLGNVNYEQFNVGGNKYISPMDMEYFIESEYISIIENENKEYSKSLSYKQEF